VDNVTALSPGIGTALSVSREGKDRRRGMWNLLTVKETTTGSLVGSPPSSEDFFMRYPPGGLGKTRMRNLTHINK
jgi:hypothetical protein